MNTRYTRLLTLLGLLQFEIHLLQFDNPRSVRRFHTLSRRRQAVIVALEDKS